MKSKNSIRLNKFIAESGICSRREADRYIEDGRVLINRKKAYIGDHVYAGDKVIVNGLHLEPRVAEDNIYLAFNKPVGVTCTTEQSTHGNIVDYVNHSTRVFPIGRLDKDSQGLILLTNDGDIVNKILRAENAHEKEYLVTVNKPITDEFITAMSSGVPVLGVTTKKCVVEKITPFIFKIILIQGLNRQIRRMCEYLHYEVTKLERVRIMNISVKGIPPGEWRDLSDSELQGIFKLTGNSSSQVAGHGSARSSDNKNGNPKQTLSRNLSDRKENSFGKSKKRRGFTPKDDHRFNKNKGRRR